MQMRIHKKNIDDNSEIEINKLKISLKANEQNCLTL